MNLTLLTVLKGLVTFTVWLCHMFIQLCWLVFSFLVSFAQSRIHNSFTLPFSPLFIITPLETSHPLSFGFMYTFFLLYAFYVAIDWEHLLENAINGLEKYKWTLSLNILVIGCFHTWLVDTSPPFLGFSVAHFLIGCHFLKFFLFMYIISVWGCWILWKWSQTGVNCHVGAGNWTWVFWKSNQ